MSKPVRWGKEKTGRARAAGHKPPVQIGPMRSARINGLGYYWNKPARWGKEHRYSPRGGAQLPVQIGPMRSARINGFVEFLFAAFADPLIQLRAGNGPKICPGSCAPPRVLPVIEE